MQTGDIHQLVAHVAPADADGNSVTWRSPNPLVATVDENGLVIAITQGSVKITVTTNDGGYINTCKIGVIASTTGLDNYKNKRIKIYPNPATDKLHVEFSKEDLNCEIAIFNQKGQVVFKEPAIGMQKIIDMNHLNERGLTAVMIISKGHYIVHKINVL